MNMILHDIEFPNIIHTNTLEVNNNDIQEKVGTMSSSRIRLSAVASARSSAELPRQDI
jgi:hypothetical protein